MLNEKVMVRTKDGKEYYGVLDNVNEVAASVTLSYFVPLKDYVAGTYESVFALQGIIFNVSEIWQCDEETITILENGN